MNDTTHFHFNNCFENIVHWSTLELDYVAQIQFFLHLPDFSDEIQSRDDTALISSGDDCAMNIPSTVKYVYVKAGACANVEEMELGDLPEAEMIIFGTHSFPDTRSVYLHGV